MLYCSHCILRPTARVLTRRKRMCNYHPLVSSPACMLRMLHMYLRCCIPSLQANCTEAFCQQPLSTLSYHRRCASKINLQVDHKYTSVCHPIRYVKAAPAASMTDALATSERSLVPRGMHACSYVYIAWVGALHCIPARQRGEATHFRLFRFFIFY